MSRRLVKLAIGSDASALADAAIVDAVVDGDVEAFAILIRRYNNTVFRACRAVLGDDAEAEDAVQVAWINAYRALAGFRGESSFRSWIVQIAINEASARRHKRLRSVPDADAIDDVASSSSPELEVATDELGALLERHLDELPVDQRTVLVLRDVLELDTAETAAFLGLGEAAVRVRLHRARHALAARMSGALAELGGLALPNVWRFDGERCARVGAHVMAAIYGDIATSRSRTDTGANTLP